jgi:hypothetical protein
MIYFKFKLENPWSKNDDSRDFFCKDWKISDHKNLETQLTWFGWSTLFELNIEINWRGRDHAGPRFEIILFGLFFGIQMYDSRHWNYEQNRWYLPEEEQDTYHK